MQPGPFSEENVQYMLLHYKRRKDEINKLNIPLTKLEIEQ